MVAVVLPSLLFLGARATVDHRVWGAMEAMEAVTTHCHMAKQTSSTTSVIRFGQVFQTFLGGGRIAPMTGTALITSLV